MAVSLGNFATNLVLIRGFALATFGVYAILWTLMLLLNTMQSSLIVHPMLVMAASGSRLRSRELASAAIRVTALTLAPFALVIVIACALLHRLDLAVWIIPAVSAWQIQEALRRALMSQRRYRDCIFGDMTSYCGQAVILAFLAGLGLLSLPVVFVCITVTSLLAAAIQMFQVRPAALAPGEFAGAMREFWGMGRWIANQNIVASVITAAVPWYLASMRGPVGVAEYQSLYYVTGLVQPLMLSIGSLVAVEVARSSMELPLRESLSRVSRPVLLGGIAILLYGLVLVLFPQAALSILFRSSSPYAHLTSQLRIFVLATLFLYSSQMLLEVLVGLRLTRSAFLSQVWASLACAVVGLIMIPAAGVLGAGIALAAAYLVRLVSVAVPVRKLMAGSGGAAEHRALAAREAA
jgi:hypothetical protein